MANNTYVIDILATGTPTIVVTDDGTGIDWLDFDGVYVAPTSVRLAWTTVSDADSLATSASGSYFSTGNTGHRLVVNGLIENVRGSDGNDDIIGNSAGNMLFGDQLATGPGLADTISGANGNDTIYGGAGSDDIGGGDDNDRLFGDDGADTISGGGGIDIIQGGAGADSLSGGASVGDVASYAASNAAVRVQLTFGSTTIGVGGHAAGDMINGFTNLIGSAFDDVLSDTVSGTVAFGGNDNSFSGGAGRDVLRLNGGNDTGSGGTGRDIIYGGIGNDKLFGGSEADVLTGQLGADRLTGDAGADRFVFVLAQESAAAAASRDTISDFNRTEGDKIDIAAIDAIAGGSSNNFVFIGAAMFSGIGQLRFRDAGNDVVVEGNTSGNLAPDFAILVQNVSSVNLTDFLF